MARDTMGPYETEAKAADAAYKATRATGEPHTIAALGADLLVASHWLVARGRIRECWLEKKAVGLAMIAWPVTFVSPAGKSAEESDAQTSAATQTRSGPFVIPTDELPPPKGKKA